MEHSKYKSWLDKNKHGRSVTHSIINQKQIMAEAYPELAKKYGAWPLYIYALTMQQESANLKKT